MKKICFVTAIPGTANVFLKDHMAALSENYHVYYVSSEADESKVLVSHEGYKCVNICRGISIINDLMALGELSGYFKRERFDSVHSVTPKAGLLTALAGFLARIPIRIHIFTGQVWANKKGPLRWLLKFMDKIIVLFGNNFLVDGEGQRQFLIQQGVLKEKNSRVLGYGSICGVNLHRFVPCDQARNSARNKVGCGNKTVFVFMGRLNHDKGLYDLLPAFDNLASERNDVFLLLFGRDEENIASRFKEYVHLKERTNYLCYGLTREPHTMLQAGDVFVLPTYREGFGSSVIEASALGLPVICSNAYGVRDAMVDNITGLRCNVGDVNSLYNAMKKMVDSPQLMREMGVAGRKRVMEFFDGEKMTQLWVDYYHELLPA
jgi:glycosyltransferase involved in cell wall biosynthesis